MGKLLTRFLIAVLYPVIVLISIVLLASVELRSSSGSEYDIWRLNYSANDILSKSHLNVLEKLKNVEYGPEGDLANVNYYDKCLKFTFTKDGSINKNVDKDSIAAAKADKSSGKTFDQLRNAPMEEYCIWIGFSGSQYYKEYYEAEKKADDANIQNVEGEITKDQTQYSDLIKDHLDLIAFYEMGSASSPWYMNLIVDTPYDLQVLLLVMFMGAIGGMVRLLRDYGANNRKNPSKRDYLIVPLIRMVVALGGYILGKTGLLLLSSTKDESLSPFMIGLIGIISGLLAKEVVDAIARAGKNMMTSKQGEDKVLLEGKQP